MLLFLIQIKPMNSRLLNYNEIFNELSILYGTYYIFIYSADWITNLYAKYDMGNIFVYSLLPILLINFLFIFIELGG